MLLTCEILGAQHVICMKKLRFSSRARAKVGRQKHQVLPEHSPNKLVMVKAAAKENFLGGLWAPKINS